MSEETAQRLDVWLYRVRLVKTRTLAAKMIKGGKVRLMRRGETLRIKKPHFLIRPGDQVSFIYSRSPIHVEMISPATRRGPAKEAQTLYNNLLNISEASSSS